MQLDSICRIHLLRSCLVKIRQGEFLCCVLIQNPQGLPGDGVVLCSQPASITEDKRSFCCGRDCRHGSARRRSGTVANLLHGLLAAQIRNLIGEPLDLNGKLRISAIVRLHHYGLLLRLVIVIVGIIEPRNKTSSHKRRKEWAAKKKWVPEKRTSEEERVPEEMVAAWEAGEADAVGKENSMSAGAPWIEGEKSSGGRKPRRGSKPWSCHYAAGGNAWTNSKRTPPRSKAACRHYRPGAETRTKARASHTSTHSAATHLGVRWNEENNSKYRNEQHPFHGNNPLEKIPTTIILVPL